jgi:eukaryotic-like serine/threonine-protein kinase
MEVMGDSLPATIGCYEIESELGRGTMGIVYKARDPRDGEAVALKTISPTCALSLAERVAFENRFFAEGRIVSTLSHPGIVRVHEMGRDEQSRVLFLCLEYLEGRTLDELITIGPTPWRDALKITAMVAEALHHAHSRGVVHRDVKPANIMLLPSGEAKVMDFGLARLENARFAPTLTGQVFGTPLYMSPEQAQGDTVEARSDLFSLGAILYALLTGRKPFAADTIPAIMKRIVFDDPPPPSQIARSLPPAVDALVAQMLAKSPSQRPATGRAVARQIADVLAGRVGPRRVAAVLPPPEIAKASVFDEAAVAEIEAIFERMWKSAQGAATLPLPRLTRTGTQE